MNPGDGEPVTRWLDLERGDRVLVFTPSRHRASGWSTQAEAALSRAGIEVAKVSTARQNPHGWLRAKECRPKLLIASGDALDAVESSATHDVPLLAITPHADPDVVVEQLERRRFQVQTETLLRVQPSGRTPRAVLAECVVTPGDDGGGMLRVRGEDGLDAIVPSLRVVNRDPFFLIDDTRCAHHSPDHVGLCWTGDQPVADRLIDRQVRLTITPHSGASTMTVDCDQSRFRALTERLFIGPADRIDVASAMP